MPKERRSPQTPSATPTHVVERLLTLAVLEPTIGCRQYADRLGDQGFVIAKSTVQKHLVDHVGHEGQAPGPGGGDHAATTGLVTEAARDDEPFGFCLASAGPGERRQPHGTRAGQVYSQRTTSTPPSPVRTDAVRAPDARAHRRTGQGPRRPATREYTQRQRAWRQGRVTAPGRWRTHAWWRPTADQSAGAGHRRHTRSQLRPKPTLAHTTQEPTHHGDYMRGDPRDLDNHKRTKAA